MSVTNALINFDKFEHFSSFLQHFFRREFRLVFNFVHFFSPQLESVYQQFVVDSRQGKKIVLHNLVECATGQQSTLNHNMPDCLTPKKSTRKI